MVNVIYDKRRWRIEIGNEDCPHLFYPANIHIYRISKFGEGECRLENCPLVINKESQKKRYQNN